MKLLVVVLVLICLSAGSVLAAHSREFSPVSGIKVISAVAAGGGVENADALVDGQISTAMRYPWANGGVSIILDLGKPYVVDSLDITNGSKNMVVYLREAYVGAVLDTDKSVSSEKHGFSGAEAMQPFRPLLGRPINLHVWEPRSITHIDLPQSVGRYIKLDLACGGDFGEISEIKVNGKPNVAERHLMCWSGSIQKDYLDKIDYLSRDLGATDLWLDYVDSAFPQSNYNAGFDIFESKGVFKKLASKGIRYWFAEHEAFTNMVNSPEDLRDDRKWTTTELRAKNLYSRAKKLGFRGIVYDAEDYDGVSAAAAEKYKATNEPVDAWSFREEFGYDGLYYKRGMQIGKVIKDVWGCPFIQVYEARIYAAANDNRGGNYWWLKGIHDAGIEVWIATERTYGAGYSEIKEAPDFLGKWFVDVRTYVNAVFGAYPFAARVLPGFHPWNCRTRQPNYLPKYLDQQLSVSDDLTQGYWIYNEGNPSAGDPRVTLDKSFLSKYGLKAEDYLSVFAKHKTVLSGRK